MGLSRATLGSSWGSLGSSLGPLDQPKRASRFVLELSWAWFARFLLPKMALGASWGCFWLVLGAPEGLLRVEIGLTDAKTTLKKLLGAPKERQIRPPNPPKAIFGSKKRANQAQESSKTNLEALFGRSRGPKELPRAPQELPKGAPERAPKRLQNHLWIENVDFTKM